ncbi:MAG TPA: hypothetical protein VL522_09155 [Bordetella sp.]|jgi:hypothetical protein|nr:hypothetical protein [Bordetella sp.]
MDDAARRNKKMFVARIARDNLKKGKCRKTCCGASSAYRRRQEKPLTRRRQASMRMWMNAFSLLCVGRIELTKKTARAFAGAAAFPVSGNFV